MQYGYFLFRLEFANKKRDMQKYIYIRGRANQTDKYHSKATSHNMPTF